VVGEIVDDKNTAVEHHGPYVCRAKQRESLPTKGENVEGQ
jgi:hypothetical protein